MTEQAPKKIGTEWSEKHDKAAMPVKAPRFSLTELQTDYHFFNHGALFTYGGLRFPEEDPLNDWYLLQPKYTPVVMESFRAKLFDGLGTVVGRTTWDHVLCGVRHEDWNSLWTFLCGTAIVDRKRHRYCQAFSGDVTILDPVLIERYSIFDAPLNKIPITVFCADGSDKRWEIAPADPMGVIRFVEKPAQRRVVEMAALILDGDASMIKDQSNQAITTLIQEELAKCKSS